MTDTKKMVKQVITYDDGTETVLEYSSLGEKVETPTEEKVAEAPAEAAEAAAPETDAAAEAEALQG